MPGVTQFLQSFTCQCSEIKATHHVQTSKEVQSHYCWGVIDSVNILAACEADGINYPNNDIANFAVSGSAECSQRCQSEPRCALFAYSKGRKLCWLKTKKGAATKNSDILTGFKTLGGNNLSPIQQIIFKYPGSAFTKALSLRFSNFACLLYNSEQAESLSEKPFLILDGLKCFSFEPVDCNWCLIPFLDTW